MTEKEYKKVDRIMILLEKLDDIYSPDFTILERIRLIKSISKRLPKHIESSIALNVNRSVLYSRYVIRGRFEEAEPLILTSKYSDDYLRYIKSKE